MAREREKREKQNRLLYRDKQRKTVQREGLGNKKSETDTENMRREGVTNNTDEPPATKAIKKKGDLIQIA